MNEEPAPGSASTPLRVATWNLNHWRQPLLPVDSRQAAWSHLEHGIGAQVALVQEAVPPTDAGRDRAVYGELGGHRNWGSAVVSLDPVVAVRPIRSVRIPFSRRRYLLEQTHPGSVAIAEIELPGIQPITFVSIYGVMDGPVVSTMLRVVADLVPLMDSPQGARVILGGDLNISSATKDARHIARAEAIFAAIRSLGLVEAKTLVPTPPASSPGCWCGRGGACTHISTWKGSELDHLFVTPSLTDQVTAMTVDTSVIDAGLSDHVPLVLDLALTAERTPHAWDEESFAEEIGRRHGPGARHVVEALVNWADRKERELVDVAGVRAKTLTRFPTNGTTSEPELWFQVDLEQAPKGLQYTVSARARGDVVIQFGNMRQPPFDAPDMRDELRRALNEIDGVDIPARQLNGWPKIPISVFEEPANLLRLVAVLDRIATECGLPSPDTTGAEPVTPPQAADPVLAAGGIG